MPFEHGFSLKMHFAGSTLFLWRYFVLHCCSFQTFVQIFINVMLIFVKNMSLCTLIKTVESQEFLTVFDVFFFYVFNVIFSLIHFQRNLWENTRIMITHYYIRVLAFAMPLETVWTLSLSASVSNIFLKPWHMLIHEKTCMIPDI